MTMYRFAASVSVLVTVSLLILAGCGGGNGGGGSAAPPSASQAQQVYILDFVHHKVTAAVQAKAQFVDNNPGRGTASALAMAMNFYSADTGNPGQQVLTCTVTNNTPEPVGMNDLGTKTGLDLCFVSTTFENSGSVPVTGGGYAGYDCLNPANGTPIFTIPGSLAAGATSNPRLVNIVLPATATTATVKVIVRTNTQIFNNPATNSWYLTTLAGQSGIAGYEDGLAGAARFNDVQGSLYRDDRGDLLVADYGNNRIRRIALNQGLGLAQEHQVGTWAGNGSATVCNSPMALARGAAGNVFIAEAGCISLVGPKGGNPTVIAGVRGKVSTFFNRPASLAVSGNLVYVVDEGYDAVRLLTYNGVGNPFAPGSWTTTSLGARGAGLNASAFPTGVAVDGLGNVYVADNGIADLYVLPNGSTNWTIFAGDGPTGSEKDGSGTSAIFASPLGIAVDQSGILYVTDQGGSLRRVQFQGGSLTNPSDWLVDTLVHSGTEADGPASTGKVQGLQDVSCARDGTLYLTESDDVRRLDRTANDAPPS
jgi:sugar lactone lactonase YvrE